MAGKRRWLTGSNLAASLFVGLAGVVAWYGTAGSQPAGQAGPPPTSEPATMVAERPAATPAPGVRAADGELPTRIVIPSAGIDAAVAEVGVTTANGQAAWETAWRAAGHHLDSALPGQPGNVVITGHVSVADRSNLAVFKTLDKVQPGDVVEVVSGDTTYRYQVQKVAVVAPTATNVLRSGHAATITLITCTHDLAHRLVVTGTLI